MDVYALVLAGGTGLRFSARSYEGGHQDVQIYTTVGTKLDKVIPKQLQMLDSCSVLEQTVDAFGSSEQVDYIVVVMHKEWISQANNHLRRNSSSKVVDVIEGGCTRTQSSILGVKFVRKLAKSNAKVLIHDAVRPFVPQTLIAEIVHELDEFDAVLPVIPVTQSIIQLDENVDFVYCERDKYQLVQTPQGFKLDSILAAYDLFEQADDNFKPTDDMSVLVRYLATARTKLVEGSPQNKKITYPSDLHR